MKKIALISAAAAAATLAVAPAAAFADGAPTTQSLSVKLTSSKAGTTSAPTAVGLELNTGTTSNDPAGTKQTLSHVKITIPKGIKLNYKAFKACTDPAGLTCPSNTKIGSGSAVADVYQVQDNIPGTLTPYIGTNNTLLIRTQFTQPAVIDEALKAVVSTSGGGYVFDIDVPQDLQVPIQPTGNQQIRKFDVKFSKLTTKVGKKTVPLIGLTSCPSGGYKFQGDFTFANSQPTTTTTVVKCSTAKKKK
ncbi:MAG: hypothetical protein AAGC46_04805 [Solirubrobacteraceae bacterium]|nr:hypothetical protein [Patulibacter sp.]